MIDIIIKIVCEYYEIPIEVFHSKTRKREIVQARQIAMHFSKIYTKASLTSIGSMIGAKDHATVLYACKQVSNLYDTDKFIREDIDNIDLNIRSEFNLDIEEKSRITKSEIREAIMSAYIKLLNRRISKQHFYMLRVSRDIFNACDRLYAGNASHQKATIKSLAINLTTMT